MESEFTCWKQRSQRLCRRRPKLIQRIITYPSSGESRSTLEKNRPEKGRDLLESGLDLTGEGVGEQRTQPSELASELKKTMHGANRMKSKYVGCNLDDEDD